MEHVEQSTLEMLDEYHGHEKVIRLDDEKSGLRGFIAIHSTAQGPAVGGTRMFPYATDEFALKDVLRLSRAMTYKCALAGLPYGGGKGVIIGDPLKDKTEGLLRAYARAVKDLDGSFFTGEDVGLSKEDVQKVLLTEAEFFIGKEGQAEDPSPFASLSTFLAIETAVEHVFGSRSLSGKSVAVKGVGKVGSELVRLLREAGARVVIADINLEAIASVQSTFPDITISTPSEIISEDVDIYAPCALGNEFSSENVGRLRAKIICGGANNQLVSEDEGQWLFDHDILYIPDYIANAGGLIDVADELEPGGFNAERVRNRIHEVSDTVCHVIALSKEQQMPTNEVADDLAEHVYRNTHIV